VRRLLVALGAGLALLAGVAIFTPRCAARPAEAPPRPARPAQEARVVSVHGPVERREASAWRPAIAGDALHPTESIRTGSGGEAELAVDDRSRLTVAPSSELGVRELSDVAHRFRLARGRVHVDYRANGARVLRVESEDGTAVATTQGARASALQSPDAFSVATDAGAVELSARGRTVEIAGGMQSFAWRDRVPVPPAPVPHALLVRVAERFAPTAGGCTALEGRAPPDVEATAAGAPVPVASDGRFSVPSRGAAAVSVAFRDAAGRIRTQVLRCRIRPAMSVDLRWADAPDG
jgi:FecR protein